MDSDQRPVLNQVNIIARDWDASLAFYRLLGVQVDSGDGYGPDNEARHTAVTVTGAVMRLEFDNPAGVRLFAADAAGVKSPIIGFAYPSAAAVDSVSARLAAAGHAVLQPPYDAFWGARYAIVCDPDGNAVGLMGPRDRSRGYAPTRR
jgi:predicted enzyme related to lactoylglutathione lyase